MFDKQPLKGLRRALALSVAVGLTSLSVMALVTPTSSRADDNTSTSQAQADLSSQEATAAAEKAKAQAEADKKAEEVAKAEADRLAQAEADQKAKEAADKAKEAEAQAEADRQKAKEAEAEEAKAAKAEEPATPEVQEPEAEAPAKVASVTAPTYKPVNEYFSYEKQCEAPSQLYIHLKGDAPELEVRYSTGSGTTTEQLQAGDEIWIDLKGDSLSVTVTVRDDPDNSTVVAVTCEAVDPDTDGDGYVDSKDAFPNDPKEWADADNDGVGNNSDKCADTKADADVNADGCSAEQVGTQPDETFPNDPKYNNPDTWEAYFGNGAICVKYEPVSTPFAVPANPSGYNWFSAIVKAGSGDAANELYNGIKPGNKLVHTSGKKISHVILCKVKVTPEYKYGTGLYFYKKLDPSKPATWENSGTQQFVDSKEGASDPGWFSSISKLPANVCGPGWAWQQDKQKVSKDKEIVWPATINYPVDNIGWPPIYADKHGEMSDLGITVPNCMTEFTVVVPKYTPGTCFAAGSVEAPATNQNSWMVTGPANARMYTAVPIGDVTLIGQTVFGPYDTTQVPYTDAKCKPVFQVEEKCTPRGGYVKITFVNNSKWDRWPDYSFDGDTKQPTDYGSGPTWNVVKVPSGQTKVIFEKYFAEDYGNGGPINVWFQDILGAERDIDTAKTVVSVETNCRPNIEAPAIEVLAQQCTVGDQGAGVFTGGSITITKPEGVGVATVYDEEDNEVTDLTNVLPGVYTVVVPTSDPNGEFKPLPEGWTYVGEGKNKISTTVTVQAAVDCTILPPPPVKVPGFDGYTDCYGVFARTWDEVQYPVWKDGGWVLADPVVENDTGFVKTRELTNEEWWTLGCYPESPADKVEKKHDEGLSCEGGLKTRDWKLLTTYSWKWSEDVESEFRGEWVANPSVVKNDTGWVKIRDLNASEKKELGCVLPPSLALTGGSSDGPLGLALSLIGAGLLAIWATRRKPAGLQG